MMSSSRFTTLSSILQRCLEREPELVQSLGELAGKCIGITVLNTAVEFYLVIDEQGIQIQNAADKVDMWIRATPMSWLMLLQQRDITQNWADLEISGDVVLAQRLHRIIQRIDIDVADYLSPYIGDAMGHRLGRLLQYGRTRLQQTAQSISLDLSEYLRFEKQLLPDSSLVEEFIQAVDELRFATDRLQKRIDKFASKFPESN